MKSILIPVDGSAASAAAVSTALREGPAQIARIELVNVQPCLNRHVASFIPRAVRDDWRRERARAAMEPALSRIRASGIACRAHVAVGRIGPEIALTARDLRVDEIVLGARRRGALARWISGSVAASLLELSEIPVRIVPARPAPSLGRYAWPAGIGLAALLLLASD